MENLIYVHFGDLIIGLIGIIFISIILNKAKFNNFVTTMLIFSLVLLCNITLFSLVYTIDALDSKLFSIDLYNWWSTFIRAQDTCTLTYLAILAFLRLRKKEKNL
jgi:hypothetical protein